MADLRDFDRSAHIQPEFREAFPTWADFREHLTSAARYPEFGANRAIQQALMADLASRITAVGDHDWLLIGSLGLPARVPRDFEWQLGDFAPTGIEDIDPAYVLPRSAFDLDLCAHDVTDPDPERAAALYSGVVLDAIDQVAGPAAYAGDGHGIGLGGLVRYSVADLQTYPTGQVMGVITAQPVDPRYGPGSLRAVDDPIPIEIDIKNPGKVTVTGAPDLSQRPITAVGIPGFTPYAPPLNPLVNQLADTAVLLTGPPNDLRGLHTDARPWHRYKNVFDVYFAARACHIDADTMKVAVAQNWNFKRMGMQPSDIQPYRFYGQDASRKEPQVPWREGVEAIRSGSPQLRAYPSYEQMRASIGEFMDSLPDAPEGSTWIPGRGWTLPREQDAEGAAAQPSAELDADAADAARTASLGFPRGALGNRAPGGASTQQQHRDSPERGREQGPER